MPLKFTTQENILHSVTYASCKPLQNASTLVFWMTKMEVSVPMPLMRYLNEIVDPRRTGYAHRHNLQEVLVIAICATLSDVDTFEDVAFWAEQEKVAQKSNEIAAIPELLNTLLIKKYLLTIDAMGCQTEIAEMIVAKKADFCLELTAYKQRRK